MLTEETISCEQDLTKAIQRLSNRDMAKFNALKQIIDKTNIPSLAGTNILYDINRIAKEAIK